jgi:hypothetical protein
MKAHRSGMVITFGILGIICCFPFGIAAWIMGGSDLEDMRRGRMDDSGQDATKIGRILGMVSVGLAIFSIIYMLTFGRQSIMDAIEEAKAERQIKMQQSSEQR